MNNYLFIWPKSENVVHINYHYTQFGEIIDYLDAIFAKQIIAIDCDVNNVEIIDLISNNNITKIIVQVNYENAKNAFEFCEIVKNKFKHIAILAYGPITVMLPKLFLNSKFDVIYKNGDIEVCIESFLNYYDINNSTEDNCKKLKGLNIIKGNTFFATQDGEFILEESWGMSKANRVPVKEYDKIKGKNRYVINISRGCPFHCSHCLIQLTEGRKERRRSIDNLEKCIEQISNEYKHIKIWAANFTLNKEYVKTFCQIMKRYPDITWECATRIDLVEDKEMLKNMYLSGCRQISLGIESLNNSDLINTKSFKRDEISTAISNIQDCGIQVKACIMLGMPNQTKESIINTLEFLVDRNVIIRPTIYTPYQLLNEKVDINKLSNYNRKTYENNNVPRVSYKQLLKLIKNPYDYKNII